MFLSCDTEIADEYTPIKNKNAANPKKAVVTSPNGGKGVCINPIGKAIFIPVIAGELSTLEHPDFKDAQLIQEAGACDNYSKNRRAEIDGINVDGLNDPLTFRTNSSHIFTIKYADDNIYNVKGGTGRAFSDGWYLFLILFRSVSIGYM